MENDEPHNRTDNGCNDQEAERVPREVPHAQLEPLGPDSEQKEEEGKADAKDEP